VRRRGEVGLVARDVICELPPMLAAIQASCRPEAPAGRGYRGGA